MYWLMLLLLCCCHGIKAANNTDLETRVDILETEVTNLEDDVNDVENDVRDVENEVDQNLDQIFENTNNIIDNIDDISGLSSIVQDVESTMATLLLRMTRLEEVNTNQTGTIQELEATIVGQQATIVGLEATITELESTTAGHEVIIEELKATDNSTTDLLISVQSEVQNLETEVSNHDTEISTLEEIVEDVEDGIGVLEVVNNDILDRLTELEAMIAVPWTACTSSPCQNDGTCVDVDVDAFICMCRDGYFGVTCQDIPTEACTSSPCQNGGTCVDVNVGTFICSCRDGFFGVNCEASYSDMAFLATFSVSSLTPSDPIVFDDAILNTGGHYDPTTGIYTVPIDGVYQFMLHFYNYGDTISGAHLDVDGVAVTLVYARDDADAYHSSDSGIILSLTAGQQVSISPSGMSGIYGASSAYIYSWWSGYLVHSL